MDVVNLQLKNILVTYMSIQIDLGIAIQQLRRQRGLSQERLEEGRLIYSYEKMVYGIPFVVTPLISEEQLTSSAIHSENHVAENGRKIGKRVISNQALPLFVPPVMYGSVRT